MIARQAAELEVAGSIPAEGSQVFESQKFALMDN